MPSSWYNLCSAVMRMLLLRSQLLLVSFSADAIISFLRRGRTSGRVFYNSKILSNGYNNRLCKEKNWIHIYTIKGYNVCTYIIMSILITMVSCYISRCHSSDVRWRLEEYLDHITSKAVEMFLRPPKIIWSDVCLFL